MTTVESLPEQMKGQWERFIEGLNALVAEVYSTDDNPAFVIGAQWGDMGDTDSGLPTVLVTSNLPVCIVPEAVTDMLDFANTTHNRYHGGDGDSLMGPMALADVPEEVRAEAEAMAASLGLPVDAITFVQPVDTSDLDALPTTVEGTDAD